MIIETCASSPKVFLAGYTTQYALIHGKRYTILAQQRRQNWVIAEAYICLGRCGDCLSSLDGAQSYIYGTASCHWERAGMASIHDRDSAGQEGVFRPTLGKGGREVNDGET